MTATDLQQSLVVDIYDAALDDRAWHRLPQLLNQRVKGDSAVLWVYDRGGRSDSITYNIEEKALGLYETYYRDRDPWTAKAMRQGLFSTAIIGSDLVPELDFRQTEFYTDFARRIDTTQVAGAGLALGASTFVGIGIHRPQNARRFTDVHKHALQSLLPHLSQTIRLRRRLGEARDSGRTGRAALHALPVGILICDANGRVLFANAASEALAAGGSLALGGRSGTVAARRREHSRALLRLIGAAARGGAGGGICLEGADQGRLFALVTPLPGRLSDEPGRALVALRAEAEQPAIAAATLAGMFDLTPAEAQLALALLSNRSLDEIRQARAVSENTVRTQLASVFRKTGTVNQRELVRLLSLLPTAAAT